MSEAVQGAVGSVENDAHEGAFVTSHTDKNAACLRLLITPDQHLSIHALSDVLNINKETV